MLSKLIKNGLNGDKITEKHIEAAIEKTLRDGQGQYWPEHPNIYDYTQFVCDVLNNVQTLNDRSP